MPPNDGRPILVTGATGRQGGAVLRHLLERGLPVRALTRRPDSRAALALAARGVEIAAGDMDDRPSLERTMHGVRGVYSVQDFWSAGAEREVRQGINVADAARVADVDHLVYASVGGADRNSGIDHWETKWTIEQHIRALGLPATMLRPAAFMENYYIPAVEKALLKGRLLDAIRGDIPYQTIATDDIGKFAALAFDQPDKFIGVALEIAGSELTNRAAAEVFSRVLGRPVRFRRLPMPMVRVALGREFYQMFRWFNAGGFQADIAALRRDYPQLRMRTLEEWLREEGWAGRREVTVQRDKIGRPKSDTVPDSARQVS
ncbi:MAG: NmrA/HSCARG family protein [Streptosporangiaceae bacterium]